MKNPREYLSLKKRITSFITEHRTESTNYTLSLLKMETKCDRTNGIDHSIST